MIARRRAVAGLGSAVLTLKTARAQTTARRIGLLSIGGSGARPSTWIPFFERMRELGYEEGRNVEYLRAFANGQVEIIERLAAELVAASPASIVITSAREGLAIKRTATSIPCIMFLVPGPVEIGLVPSLSRPGTNFTGLTTMDRELYAKRLELLREALPKATRVRALVGRDFAAAALGSSWMQEMRVAAQQLGFVLDTAAADAPEGTSNALRQARADGVHGLVFVLDGQHSAHRRAIAEQAIQHRLPAIFTLPDFVVAGGLMSFAARISSNARRAAQFVDRILRGASPAELPIERPTTFDLVLNQTTAQRIDLQLPHALLFRADEVIE